MDNKHTIEQDNKPLEKSALNIGSKLVVNEAFRDPRAGDRCPHCNAGLLDYDGLLNLKCKQCGYTLAGCFT